MSTDAPVDVSAIAERRLLANPVTGETFDVVEVTKSIVSHPDDLLLDSVLALRQTSTDYAAFIGQLLALHYAEVEQRLKKRGARSIPHRQISCELTEEHAPYAYDLEALREAAKLLPEDEAVKLVRHIPERVERVPAHDEPGNPISIAALAKRYAGSKVGELLARGATRAKLGDKLVIRPRKARNDG